MNDTQADMLAKRREVYEKRDDRFAHLYGMILAEGGEQVVPVPEPDIDLLLAMGEPLPPSTVEMRPGAPNNCHDNSWQLHDENPDLEVWTGYALSADGLWRAHSWCVDGPTIVETTTPRTAYWGVRLT